MYNKDSQVRFFQVISGTVACGWNEEDLIKFTVVAKEKKDMLDELFDCSQHGNNLYGQSDLCLPD